jgi:hypothetical protein
MDVDIENDKYDHVVTDKNTGVVIHEEHETLTGHNTKKNKSRENEGAARQIVINVQNRN